MRLLRPIIVSFSYDRKCAIPECVWSFLARDFLRKCTMHRVAPPYLLTVQSYFLTYLLILRAERHCGEGYAC